jgi:hypothetical protein
MIKKVTIYLFDSKKMYIFAAEIKKSTENEEYEST